MKPTSKNDGQGNITDPFFHDSMELLSIFLNRIQFRRTGQIFFQRLFINTTILFISHITIDMYNKKIVHVR